MRDYSERILLAFKSGFANKKQFLEKNQVRRDAALLDLSAERRKCI